MTKAERIRELKARHPHLTSGEISEVIGCNDAYVRAVWQRMRGTGGQSDADRAYEKKCRAKFGGRSRKSVRDMERYRSDPEFRAKRKERAARWKAGHPEKNRESVRRWRERKKAEREASHA